MSKKDKHKKTNALRMLDTHKVTYEISEYEWEDGRNTGLHVVEALGLEAPQVSRHSWARGLKRALLFSAFP